jgi:hypothetical protein
MSKTNALPKPKSEDEAAVAGPSAVEAAVAIAPAPVARPLPLPLAQLTMDRFGLLESFNPGFYHCAPKGVTIEQLLDPSYWCNYAGRLGTRGRNTTIQVHWDDSSQFAELYVFNYGRNWVSVGLLRHCPDLRPGAPAPKAERFFVHHNGPVEQHRIVNLDTNTVLRSGFATEIDAQRFLAEHLKKLA